MQHRNDLIPQSQVSEFAFEFSDPITQIIKEYYGISLNPVGNDYDKRHQRWASTIHDSPRLLFTINYEITANETVEINTYHPGIFPCYDKPYDFASLPDKIKQVISIFRPAHSPRPFTITYQGFGIDTWLMRLKYKMPILTWVAISGAYGAPGMGWLSRKRRNSRAGIGSTRRLS